jgi:hypothetical protein
VRSFGRRAIGVFTNGSLPGMFIVILDLKYGHSVDSVEFSVGLRLLVTSEKTIGTTKTERVQDYNFKSKSRDYGNLFFIILITLPSPLPAVHCQTHRVLSRDPCTHHALYVYFHPSAQTSPYSSSALQQPVHARRTLIKPSYLAASRSLISFEISSKKEDLVYVLTSSSS